jgi:hypothetical protein
MPKLAARWHIPAAYEPDLEHGSRVIRQRGTPTMPTLQLLSYVAFEQQLTNVGPGSLLAWQLLADADTTVATIVDALLEDPNGDRLWCAHASQLVGASASRSGEVAKLAWQAPFERQTDKVDAGLMLAVSVAAASADKARQFLPKIEPGLVHATPEQRATYALVRASLSNEEAPLDEAYDQFAALENHFGVAQCALVAYQREHTGGRDPILLRGYLEHAVYRYDIGRRESWAARLITYGVLPLLSGSAADEELVTWLQRAALFATGARSLPELNGVFRLARRLGFEATVSTLETGDPPQFTRVGPPLRQSQPVIEAPVAAASVTLPTPAPEAAPVAKPEAKPSKGGKKKKGKTS